MANKVRLSYRMDDSVAIMVTELAQKYGIEKTLVVEIAIRQLNNDQTPLAAAFPLKSTTPPADPPQS